VRRPNVIALYYHEGRHSSLCKSFPEGPDQVGEVLQAIACVILENRQHGRYARFCAVAQANDGAF